MMASRQDGSKRILLMRIHHQYHQDLDQGPGQGVVEGLIPVVKVGPQDHAPDHFPGLLKGRVLDHGQDLVASIDPPAGLDLVPNLRADFLNLDLALNLRPRNLDPVRDLGAGKLNLDLVLNQRPSNLNLDLALNLRVEDLDLAPSLRTKTQRLKTPRLGRVNVPKGRAKMMMRRKERTPSLPKQKMPLMLCRKTESSAVEAILREGVEAPAGEAKLPKGGIEATGVAVESEVKVSVENEAEAVVKGAVEVEAGVALGNEVPVRTEVEAVAKKEAEESAKVLVEVGPELDIVAEAVVGEEEAAIVVLVAVEAGVEDEGEAIIEVAAEVPPLEIRRRMPSVVKVIWSCPAILGEKRIRIFTWAGGQVGLLTSIGPKALMGSLGQAVWMQLVVDFILDPVLKEIST